MVRTVPSFIAARTEALAAAADAAEQRQTREAWEAPIRAIDRLVARLEELNIEGRQRVPASMGAELEDVVGLLPPELREEAAQTLRPKLRVTRLLDELFRFQQDLLVRRAGPASGEDDDDWVDLTASGPAGHGG